MHDVIFRGQRADTKEWIYGSLLKMNDKLYICPYVTGDLNDVDFGYGFYEVLKKTIGQSVGILCDGLPTFFEGDILEHNNTKYTVEYSSSLCEFVCNDRFHRTRGGFTNWRDMSWLNNVKRHVKFVGTVHDKEIIK